MLLSMKAVCGHVAFGALALAHEDALAGQLLLVALFGSSRPDRVEFGAGGKSMMFCICAIIAT